MKPVEIGGKYHLYRPVELPLLVKPNKIPYNHKGPEITEAELADKNSKQKKLSSDDSYLFLTHFPSKRKRYHDTAEQKPLKLQRSENRNPVTSRRQARRNVRLGVLINQLAKLLLQTRMMLSLNARDQRYMLYSEWSICICLRI